MRRAGARPSGGSWTRGAMCSSGKRWESGVPGPPAGAGPEPPPPRTGPASPVLQNAEGAREEWVVGEECCGLPLKLSVTA